ncbi:MAG: hypothetical protein JW807_08470 [Spirochaetes bacterium]|nr:hypothetical protein [Spirochaetota bacterium]
MSLCTVRAWAGGVTISLGANAMYTAWQPPWAGGRTLIPPYYFSMSDPSNFSPELALLNRSSVPMTINEFEDLHGPLAGPSLAVSFTIGGSK